MRRDTHDLLRLRATRATLTRRRLGRLLVLCVRPTALGVGLPVARDRKV